MRREGPRALREMTENVLHERGAFEWTTYDPLRKRARMLCVALLLDLMASNGSCPVAEIRFALFSTFYGIESAVAPDGIVEQGSVRHGTFVNLLTPEVQDLERA